MKLFNFFNKKNYYCLKFSLYIAVLIEFEISIKLISSIRFLKWSIKTKEYMKKTEKKI